MSNQNFDPKKLKISLQELLEKLKQPERKEIKLSDKTLSLLSKAPVFTPVIPKKITLDFSTFTETPKAFIPIKPFEPKIKLLNQSDLDVFAAAFSDRPVLDEFGAEYIKSKELSIDSFDDIDKLQSGLKIAGVDISMATAWDIFEFLTKDEGLSYLGRELLERGGFGGLPDDIVEKVPGILGDRYCAVLEEFAERLEAETGFRVSLHFEEDIDFCGLRSGFMIHKTPDVALAERSMKPGIKLMRAWPFTEKVLPGDGELITVTSLPVKVVATFCTDYFTYCEIGDLVKE